MIAVTDLKQFVMLGYLTDEMLEKKFDARTEQFVKTIKLHPEISKLI